MITWGAEQLSLIMKKMVAEVKMKIHRRSWYEYYKHGKERKEK